MKRIITVLVLCSMLLAITGCSEINFVPVNDETLNDEQVSTVDPENQLIVEDEQNANVESDRTSDQESNIISAEAVVSQGTTVTEDVIDEEAASDVDGDIVAVVYCIRYVYSAFQVVSRSFETEMKRACPFPVLTGY